MLYLGCHRRASLTGNVGEGLWFAGSRCLAFTAAAIGSLTLGVVVCGHLAVLGFVLIFRCKEARKLVSFVFLL